MKLHLTSAKNNYLITGYGDDYIAINKQKYTQNLIVLPNRLILNWQATDFASLAEAHFEILIALQPELVLLGTGATHQFLHPKTVQKLTLNNIPLECMNTAAACRTYNILMSEGRNVAALLLI